MFLLINHINQMGDYKFGHHFDDHFWSEIFSGIFFGDETNRLGQQMHHSLSRVYLFNLVFVLLGLLVEELRLLVPDVFFSKVER